jgi:hypothetical protein
MGTKNHVGSFSLLVASRQAKRLRSLGLLPTYRESSWNENHDNQNKNKIQRKCTLPVWDGGRSAPWMLSIVK